jgi:hypothetical protein
VTVAVGRVVVEVGGVQPADDLGVGQGNAAEGGMQRVDPGVDDGDRRAFTDPPELVQADGSDHLEAFGRVRREPEVRLDLDHLGTFDELEQCLPAQGDGKGGLEQEWTQRRPLGGAEPLRESLQLGVDDSGDGVLAELVTSARRRCERQPHLRGRREVDDQREALRAGSELGCDRRRHAADRSGLRGRRRPHPPTGQVGGGEQRGDSQRSEPLSHGQHLEHSPGSASRQRRRHAGVTRLIIADAHVGHGTSCDQDGRAGGTRGRSGLMADLPGQRLRYLIGMAKF